MTIGERIKLIREGKKLSMAAFGEEIKMTSSNISKMEKGTRVVTDRTIALICKEFDVNEHWLRTGEGEPYIPKNEDDELTDLLFALTTSEDDALKQLAINLPKLSPKDMKAVKGIVDALLEKQKNGTP